VELVTVPDTAPRLKRINKRKCIGALLVV